MMEQQFNNTITRWRKKGNRQLDFHCFKNKLTQGQRVVTRNRSEKIRIPTLAVIESLSCVTKRCVCDSGSGPANISKSYGVPQTRTTHPPAAIPDKIPYEHPGIVT
ncbi:hypothetical protein GWI33_015397, partial [Rhynchophorus ferrugineus]